MFEHSQFIIKLENILLFQLWKVTMDQFYVMDKLPQGKLLQC